MKYFTPELYVRGQAQDNAVLNAVEHAWEAAGEHYAAYLQQIRAELPDALLDLFDHFYLHDSAVLGIGKRGDDFLIVLQLDTPPHDLLFITYALTAEPVIDPAALPAQVCGTSMAWMYDEVELVHAGDTRRYQQSILFSNGWEITLRFRDVQVQAAAPVYPARRSPCSATAPLAG